jgi:hypothetical protein
VDKRYEMVLYLAAAGGSDYERRALGRPLLSSAPLALTLTATQPRYRQAFASNEDKTLLRIRDDYTGSANFFIPDPGSEFFHLGSASKYLSIITQKIVSKLSEILSGLFIPDPDPGSLLFTHPGSRIQG